MEYKGQYEENDEILEWNQVTQASSNAIKMSKRKKRFLTVCICMLCMVSLYLTIVYSDNAFIKKWRTIYIETAMTTTSHKWLATLFFPDSVIDEVMANQKDNLNQQKKLSSSWDEDNINVINEQEKDFFEKYWELDSDSVRKYFEKESKLTKDGYDSILIEDFEQNKKLQTVHGDPIYVIDTENNLLIIGVSGDGFKGKMAIVKNPNQVSMAKALGLGSYGQEAESFAETNDALLVMNASGFVDVDGVGTGGQVKGSLLVDGVEYGSPSTDATWRFCGMKNNNKMYVTGYPSGEVSEYRWGMEFRPALIVDGKSVVNDTFGMGIQPRAAIGQTKNGDVLLLVVDGRQVGYSLGCTVADCTDIFMEYKGYQGMNLDGGSSAVMWYKGNYITSSSSVTGKGRYMPNAFIVKRATDADVVIPSVPANEE